MNDDLTVMLLTYNEEANIVRTLAAVSWARDILVIDSGSTDSTLDLLKRYPQVRVVFREFDTFAGQCNFGLTQVFGEWVLSMDADYVVTRELAGEIQGLDPDPQTSGFRARFAYLIHGRALRTSLYPPRCVLYRRDRARYLDEGHGHRVQVQGAVDWLKGAIEHDDRKPLSRWLRSQLGYASKEAEHLLTTPSAELGRIDRLRLLGWAAPIMVAVYVLLWKGCLFQGLPGWHYALQRLIAECLISLEIADRRLQRARTYKRSPI